MKNKLGIVACSLFLATGALCVAAILPIPDFATIAASGNNECCCGDIVFGDEVLTNYSDYQEVSSTTQTDNLYSDTTVLTSDDFSFTGWANASYKSNKNSGKKNNAILIGGKNNGQSNGSFSIKLKGYTCDKVIVYADGWKGDNAATLNVDNCNKTYTVQNDSNSYDFSVPMEFTFNKTSNIKLNNSNNSKKANQGKGARRVLISKIVFRLYKSN